MNSSLLQPKHRLPAFPQGSLWEKNNQIINDIHPFFRITNITTIIIVVSIWGMKRCIPTTPFLSCL